MPGPERSNKTEPPGPRVGRVVDALRHQIIIGELPPGQRLIEGQIAASLATSRGPVREALRQLEYEGLVASIPYRGAVVATISDEEVEVLMALRVTLERFSFTKALRTAAEAELAELSKVVWQMERAAERHDIVGVVEADLRFHHAVLEMSGAPHTMQVWSSIEPRIRAYFHRFDRDRDLREVWAEHRELFDALVAGNEERLLKVLVDHINVPIPAN